MPDYTGYGLDPRVTAFTGCPILRAPDHWTALPEAMRVDGDL